MLSRPVEARLSDLHVYLGAVSSPSLYDFIRGNAPFTYPPFAALLFRPLAALPLPTVQVLWTLATIATVAATAILAARSRTTRTQAGWVALALMLSAPFSSNMRFGQVSVFLAALVLADLLLLRHSRWCGVLIGMTAAIKLTPLIFIPLLFLSARRQAAVTATATFIACTLLAAAARPDDSLRFWTAEIFQVSRLGNITSAGNQSLNGMLLRLAVPDSPRTALTLLIAGTVAALALGRAAQAARSDDWLTATIITGAASVVLSPVSWTHHQIWLVLAALLTLPTRRAQALWTGVVLAMMLLPSTALHHPVATNSRLFLAVAIAALIPFTTTRKPPSSALPVTIPAQPHQRTAPLSRLA
jgi:alpha-1,2-mannosyltransferase